MKKTILALFLSIVAVVIAIGSVVLEKPVEVKIPETVAGGSASETIVNQGTIFDVTTDGTATSSPYTLTIPWSGAGWRGGSFMFENMANATVTIWGSNDPMASSSVAQFTDMTTNIIGSASFSTNNPVFVNDNIIATRLRFTITTSTSAQSSVRVKAAFSTK